jgi:hypothetical protein
MTNLVFDLENLLREMNGKPKIDERILDPKQREEWEAKNPRGRIRPRISTESEPYIREKVGHKSAPVPWVSGPNMYANDWASVKDERAREAFIDKLCIVCGLELDSNHLWGLVGGSPIKNTEPAPTHCHPYCIYLASLFCPALKKAEYPAETPSGVKLTHQTLKKIAMEDQKRWQSEQNRGQQSTTQSESEKNSISPQ